MTRLERIRAKIQQAKDNIEQFETHFDHVVAEANAIHAEIATLENQIDETNAILQQWSNSDR